jgi:hypothetical protein
MQIRNRKVVGFITNKEIEISQNNKFNSLVSTQTDLDKFLTIIQVKYIFIFRNFQNFPIIEKVPNKASLKTYFAKI